jgi:hypothetical protein
MKCRLIFVFVLVAVLVLVLALKRSGYTMPKKLPTSNVEIKREIALVTGELSNASPETPMLFNMLNTYQLNLLRPKVSPQVFQVVQQLVNDSSTRGRVNALANQQNSFKSQVDMFGRSYRGNSLVNMIDSLPNQMEMVGRRQPM